MRSGHIVILTTLIVAAAACGSGADRKTDAADRSAVAALPPTPSTDLAARPLTRAELSVFAVLPTVMVGDGPAPTPAQVALGRRLYHETLLSDGHDVSCNSCHALNGYGADGRPVSYGNLGHTGGRNSPSVYNAAGHFAQFWDGRAKTVEEQAIGPILNPAEMAMPNPDAVLAHLEGSPAYRSGFSAAFPGEQRPITYSNVGRAIGAFERGLVTPARWDKYLQGDSSVLTSEERRGLATFVRIGCAGCHSGSYVGGQAFRRLGAARPWPTQRDSGRFKVTNQASDLYVFKVASLRNVEKTSPYFHDGSVGSLDQAIRLMGLHQLGVQLSDAQVRDIRAWLGSLTGELPADYIAEPPLPKKAP